MQDNYKEDSKKELLEYSYTVLITYGSKGKDFSIQDAELLSLSKFDVASDLEKVVRYLRE